MLSLDDRGRIVRGAPKANQNVASRVDVVSCARNRDGELQVPRHVWVRESLPMNATGNVLVDDLQAMLRGKCKCTSTAEYRGSDPKE